MGLGEAAEALQASSPCHLFGGTPRTCPSQRWPQEGRADPRWNDLSLTFVYGPSGRPRVNLAGKLAIRGNSKGPPSVTASSRRPLLRLSAFVKTFILTVHFNDSS